MRISCSFEAPDGGLRDVLVDADASATVGQLRDALVRALAAPPGGSLWVHDRLVDDDASLGDAGVRNGVVLSLTGATKTGPPVPADRGWQLHVVSGPDAGTMFDLPIGSHVVGRAEGLVIRDPAVSRRHLRLDVTAESATALDLGSGNGTLLDGQPVPREGEGEPVGVTAEQLLHIGDTLLAIRVVDRQRAALEPVEDGLLEVTRPPRIRPRQPAGRVVIPTPPGHRRNRSIPWIATLIPLVLGGLMAWLMHSPTYLLFALLSPVMAVANYFSSRRESAKDAKEAWADYTKRAEAARVAAETARADEVARRRADSPDLTQLVDIATRPGPRLWERRPKDDDFLVLRIGSAHQPAGLVVQEGAEENHPPLQDVPAVVDLPATGVLGIAGPQELVDGIARSLAVQLAVRHTPRDVRMVFLTAERRPAEWSWLRWLPHVMGTTPDEPVGLIGNDAESIAKRVGELLELVKARQSLTNSRTGGTAFQAYVVMLEGARALRSIPGVQGILADGPAVGVHAICLESEQRLLPEECGTVIVPDPTETARVRIVPAAGAPIEKVLADRLSVAYAIDVARALSPLRDRGREEGDASLPDSARLLDLIDLEPPTDQGVAASWSLHGSSTSFVLGAGIGGPFRLDIRSDGPHGLIAGTTGSGKSELLQTIIASLAVVNRPDAMNFVLVDYKGGSAFKDCVRLPHTVGMVTDLDAHLVERALASLGAELKYREHQLAGIGAKDIEDYEELRQRDGGVPALPRLMIVIDEFASMARDLPNFITGLVNIAQRGRSLGIHLLLATQRPSGAVSPEIRANTNLRISLRVLDAADSSDVLEAPDAARISKSTPGRGFARLGHGALAPFQTGRVGGRRPGLTANQASVFVAEVAWGATGYAPPRPPVAKAAQVAADDTDLAALVAAVRGAHETSGIPEQRRPWLDALPDVVLLDAIAPEPVDVTSLPPIVYGITDLPSEQAQIPAAFDLDDFTHQFLVGGSRSGRTQFLRTLAASVARSTSVDNVHIYALDCGAGGLNALASLPHVGAVVARNEPERATRLFARIGAEIERRKHVLSVGNFSDIREQRAGAAPADRLPHLLFLIDRFETFSASIGELEGGRYLDQTMAMLREGASVGVHLFITGDRSLVSYRYSSLTENKMTLRLPDRSDYSAAGVPTKKVPDEPPPGRAYEGDDATETQIAVLVPDLEGSAQAAAVDAIGVAARARDAAVPAARRPFRLDVTPAQISYDDAAALRPAHTGALWAMVGVGGDELAAYGVDLGVGAPTFLIGGPPRSGRTTALTTVVHDLCRTGARFIVGAGKGGEFESFFSDPAVHGVVTPETSEDDWEALFATADPGLPLFVLLDDAEQFREAVGKDVIRGLIRGERGRGRGLVVAGSAAGLNGGLTGWMAELRQCKKGLLLSPQDTDAGELVGTRLPRSNVGGPVQPGRGLLFTEDVSALAVQVPQTPLASVGPADAVPERGMRLPT